MTLHLLYSFHAARLRKTELRNIDAFQARCVAKYLGSSTLSTAMLAMKQFCPKPVAHAFYHYATTTTTALVVANGAVRASLRCDHPNLAQIGCDPAVVRDRLGRGVRGRPSVTLDRDHVEGIQERHERFLWVRLGRCPSQNLVLSEGEQRWREGITLLATLARRYNPAPWASSH